jgi:hypothetical protein
MKTCVIIEAEHSPDFQEYCYEDGTTVPHGEPIGVEVTDSESGEVELVLLEGVYFSPEPFNDKNE